MHLNQLLTAEVIAALWAAGYDVVKKGEAPPWMEACDCGFGATTHYRMKGSNRWSS